jgi:putative ABC transport system permease protein
MNILRHLAWRFFQARKKRAWYSIIGISLGITLLITSQILIASIETSNEITLKQKYGDYDLEVGYQYDVPYLTDQDVKWIKQLKEVKESTPTYYPYLGKKEDQVRGIWGQPAYVGVRFQDSIIQKDRFLQLHEGIFPKPGEVVLPASLAKQENWQVGDLISFPFPPHGNKKVKVSGILKEEEQSRNFVLFSYQWLQQVTASQGHTTSLKIKLDHWTSKEKVIEQLKLRFPKLFIDKQEAMDRERENIGGLKPVIQGLNITKCPFDYQYFTNVFT